MFTPGSKYFLGLAGFSTAFMIAYIVVVDQWDGGATALASIACAAGLLAGLSLFNRDGDVTVGDTSAAANAAPVGASLWPLVATIGVVLLAVGLITHEIVFLLGLVAIAASFIERVGIGRHRIQQRGPWPSVASTRVPRSGGSRSRRDHRLVLAHHVGRLA